MIAADQLPARRTALARQHPVRRITAAGALFLAFVAAGCSDQGEDYCAALTEEQRTLTDLADATNGQDLLTPTLESFQRLQAAAPEELQDEWETLVVAYEALADAVDAAGIDPGDYDPDKPPPGLSKQEADQLADVASEVGSTRVRHAALGIQQHADEVCGVDFAG